MISTLKLPFQFDASRLKSDLRRFAPEDWTPHFNTQYYEGDWSGIALRAAKNSNVELYPDQDKKWGLSFLINTRKTAEGRSPGSLAWAGLANTYFWLDPARNVGGVILMQLLPFADTTALQAFASLEYAVYRSLDGTLKAA